MTAVKILVTGGAGFIGSHIAEAYLRAGHAVVVVDNLSTGRKSNIPVKARLYQSDIRDTAAMEKIFRQEKPAVVNHHAAQIDVRASVQDPSTDASVNVLAGVGLLEAGRKHGVKKWIVASTGGALYGEVPRGQPKEDSPIRPVSPYGTSKYCLEKYFELYHRLYRLHTTILRYTNVYGPRQIPKAEGGVIAVFIEAMLAKQGPTLFGNGRQMRDFVYVEDVAKANLAALNKTTCTTVNIGSGQTTSILQLFRLLQKELHFEGKARFAPKRPGEIFRSAAAIGLARRTLDWRPGVPLHEGLRKTIAWHLYARQAPQIC